MISDRYGIAVDNKDIRFVDGEHTLIVDSIYESSPIKFKESIRKPLSMLRFYVVPKEDNHSITISSENNVSTVYKGLAHLVDLELNKPKFIIISKGYMDLENEEDLRFMLSELYSMFSTWYNCATPILMYLDDEQFKFVANNVEHIEGSEWDLIKEEKAIRFYL